MDTKYQSKCQKMQRSVRFRDSEKLWNRIQLIHDTAELIGTQLEGQFDSFNSTYKHINQYFYKCYHKNLTKIKDLIRMNLLKSNPLSVGTKIFLENKDFKNIELQLSIYETLRNLHNMLINDVLKVLGQEYSNYIPQHSKGFNKMLQCINCTKTEMESLDNEDSQDRFHGSQSDLPPHEKLWSIFCLIEREIFALCTFFESLELCENNHSQTSRAEKVKCGVLPAINYTNNRSSPFHHESSIKSLKNTKPEKQFNLETNINYWQQSLRNYNNTTKIYNYSSMNRTTFPQNCKELSLETNNFSLLDQNLKICKWNLREPVQSSRKFRPLCNRVDFFRDKYGFSQSPGHRNQTSPKTIVNGNECELNINIDSLSGRMISVKESGPRKHESINHLELHHLNQKLASLQESISKLISNRDTINHQSSVNPLHNQIDQTLDCIKSLHLYNSNENEHKSIKKSKKNKSDKSSSGKNQKKK